jgi:hypothetical protein
VHAEWVENGVPGILNPENNSNTQAVGDGGGGVIAVFQYGSLIDDIYAQRWDSRGNVMWGPSGVAVCTANGFQDYPVIVSDDAGGAVVAWLDLRSGSFALYTQHINAGGTVTWAANGVQLTFDPLPQFPPEIASDGNGGAIVSWFDNRLADHDIYAQRVTSTGVTQWLIGGVPICTAFAGQSLSKVIPDGAGGAIVSWEDSRSGLSVDLYAQRVNSAGITQWGIDGEPVVTEFEDQRFHATTTDGASGVLVVWQDFRNLEWDIFGQRLDSGGNQQWGAQGRNYCVDTGEQRRVKIIPDGAGGGILAWEDFRDLNDYQIYAQRVTATGLGMWEFNGVLICNAGNDQREPRLAMDGERGAVIAWTDGRSSTEPNDVYAQRVDAFGQVQWNNNGVPVGTAVRSQHDPNIVASPDGGFVLVYDDLRAGWGLAYAQRIGRRYGEWGNPEPVIDSVADVPADQGGVVNVNWLASGRDNLNQQLIGNYSIWRAIDQTAFAAATTGAAPRGKVVAPEAARALLDRDTYTVQHTAAGDFFWQWIGDQASTYSPAYSFPAQTQFDSVSVDPGTHYFRVIAHHTWDQYIFWESQPDSGYSVDNVAPGSPFLLAAMRAGGSDVDLDWSPSGVADPDFAEYHVFRGLVSGFPTDPAHFLTSTPDTMTVDTNADPGIGYWYKVVAVDVHENQSDDSNEAMVDPIPTGIGDTPALGTLQVTNFPNPFSGATEIRVGVPGPADVTVQVYDVAGRRVFERSLTVGSAGWQSVAFAGRSPAGELLPSGVYFARVTAGADTHTRKLVISR